MADLRIKNYYPLDQRDNAKNSQINALNIRTPETDNNLVAKNPKEDREFTVGLIALICITIFLIVFFLIKINLKKTDSTVQNQPQNQTASQPQVAGASTQNNNQTQSNSSSQSSSSKTTQNSTSSQSSQSNSSSQPSSKTYTVQSGDTLYSIAQKYTLDWHKIADLNNISSATALKVGQVLSIPQ
jgi:LysM repeat protein